MRRKTAILVGAVAMAASSSVAQDGMHAAPQRVEVERAPIVLGEIGRRLRDASPGATVEIAEGVYREHLRIEKPVQLVARGTVVIDGDGNGDIIDILAPDVTVRGFTIRNTGTDLDKENVAIRVSAPRTVIEGNTLEDILFGIDLREAPDSRIAGNRIGGKDLDIARRGDGLRLWRSDRTIVEDNVIHDGRDAILWYSKGIVVRRNLGYDSRYGLHLMFSDEVTITDNEFRGNSVGIYLMYSSGVEILRNRLLQNRGPSGYGIGLKEADRFTVRENLFAGNRSGIYLDGSPFTESQPGVFTLNTIAYNDAGCTILPSARGNEFTENNFIDNIDQVAVAGRGALAGNRFWKGERGNFWSDYTGYDQNGDGVGDFVHESQTLFEDLMAREPSLRLFLFSPAQQAIEFVARAIPAVRPEPKFADEVPLMRPVAEALPTTTDLGASGPLAAAGLVLAATACGVVLLAFTPVRRPAMPAHSRGDRQPQGALR